MPRMIKIENHPNVGDLVVLATGRFVRVLGKKATTVPSGESRAEKGAEEKEKKHKAPAFSYLVEEIETGQEWTLVHPLKKVGGRSSYGFSGAAVVSVLEMRGEMARREKSLDWGGGGGVS